MLEQLIVKSCEEAVQISSKLNAKGIEHTITRITDTDYLIEAIEKIIKINETNQIGFLNMPLGIRKLDL